MNSTVFVGVCVAGAATVSLLITGAASGDMALCFLGALFQWIQWGCWSMARYHRERAEVYGDLHLSILREMLREKEAFIAEFGRRPASWRR